MKSSPSVEFWNLLNGKENLDFYLVLYLGEDNHVFPDRDVSDMPLDPDGYILSISDMTLLVREAKGVLNTADLGLLDVRLVDVIDTTALLFKNYRYANPAEIRLRSATLHHNDENIPLISGTIMSPYDYDFAQRNLHLTLETFSYDLTDTMIMNPDIGYEVEDENWVIVLGDHPNTYDPVLLDDQSFAGAELQFAGNNDFPAIMEPELNNDDFGDSGIRNHDFPREYVIEGNDDNSWDGTQILYLPVGNHKSGYQANFPTTMQCNCTIAGNTLTIQRGGWDLGWEYSEEKAKGLHNIFWLAYDDSWANAQYLKNRIIWKPQWRTLTNSNKSCSNYFEYNYPGRGYYIKDVGTSGSSTTLMTDSNYFHTSCIPDELGQFVWWYSCSSGSCVGERTWGIDWVRSFWHNCPVCITNYPEGDAFPMTTPSYSDKDGWMGTRYDMGGTFIGGHRAVQEDILKNYLDLYFIGGEPISTIPPNTDKTWLADRIFNLNGGSAYEVFDADTLDPITENWYIDTVSGVDLVKATSAFDQDVDILLKHHAYTFNGTNLSNPVMMMRRLMDNCDFEYDTSFGIPSDGGTPDLTVYNNSYPGAIMTTSMIPVLPDIQRMAWEARCSLRLSGTNTFNIRFLPTFQPVADLIITDDMVIHNSVRIASKDVRELKTVFLLTDDNDVEYEYYRNDDIYGEYVYKDKIMMYRDSVLIDKIIDFWGYNLSHPWLRLTFNMRLVGSLLEVYDIIQLPFLNDILQITGDIYGKILRTRFSPKTKDIEIYAELPLISTSGSPDPKYWTGENFYGENVALASRGAIATQTDGADVNLIIDGVSWNYSETTGFGWVTTPLGEMKVDLGSIQTIRHMSMLLWDLDTRYYQYKIEYSTDDVLYFTFVDNTIGQHTSWQQLPAGPTSMRYVKITGTGGDVGTDFRVVELEVFI